MCGDSDTLAEELKGGVASCPVVAADGATSTLLALGIRPDIIVTDLDGDVGDQISANASGSVVFVHAHGDNMGAVSEYVPEFKGPLVCTCQCPPVEKVRNFGGFTDGDRAACISAAIGVKRIWLAGFDFDRPAEKAGRSPEVKARKLAWARRILEMLAEEGVLLEPFTLD